MIVRAPPMVISTSGYFVGPIVTHHFEATQSFFAPIVNSKTTHIGSHNFTSYIILYLCLTLLQLKILLIILN